MKNLRNFVKRHQSALLLAAVLLTIVLFVLKIIQIRFHKWSEEIIYSNIVITQSVSNKMLVETREMITDLQHELVALGDNVTQKEVNRLNMALSAITDSALKTENGLEGGFYLTALDEFIGYSYPTSPPPLPAYGPPPRSYSIIKEQVLQTIQSQKPISKVHRFDPAIFPLTTLPLIVDNKVIGALWTRIHIERQLPESKLPRIYAVTAYITLLGFLALILASFIYRSKVRNIYRHLEKLKTGKNERLPNAHGTIGHIAGLINNMVDTLQHENQNRRALEIELHEKEKMAALGRLVAGVAHEVKTPLAIIKTRIQMWKKELKKYTNDSEICNEESIRMVLTEIDRLSNLVKRLLTYSKPVTVNRLPSNINDLLEDVVKLVQTREFAVPIEYELDLDPQMPLVQLDYNLIKEVFINILFNAQESIETSGKITVASSYQDSKSIVMITDTGSGIRDEHFKFLGDPFFSTKTSGAGLGLAISSQKIKAHNGSILFGRNTPNGTVVTITLPVNNGAISGKAN